MIVKYCKKKNQIQVNSQGTTFLNFRDILMIPGTLTADGHMG